MDLSIRYGFATAQKLPLAIHPTEIFDYENPSIILTQSPNDHHTDHRALSAAMALATAEKHPIADVDNMKAKGRRRSVQRRALTPIKRATPSSLRPFAGRAHKPSHPR
jgi:LmbE family N-acetylglucosaminyl deacetylase